MVERLRVSHWLIPLLASSCTGAIGETAGAGSGSEVEQPQPGSPSPWGGGEPTPPGSTGPNVPGAEAIPVGDERPLRLLRLTREEYANTLRDLLGDDTDVSDDLPVDTAVDTGFVQSGPVGTLEARRFMDLAESAAARALRNPAALMGCDPAVDEAACITSFLARFLRRAYRRPPIADEVTAARAHYDRVRALRGQDVLGATRALVAAVLQAPSFLYHWELGPKKAPRPDARGDIALDDHELGSRLSYFITQSMPDEALFAQADGGKLRDPAVLVAEARRLLATPRALQMVRSFHDQWLGLGKIGHLEKDTGVYKTFTEDMRSAMEAEKNAFIDHVVFDGDGKLDTLFGADFSFLNATLAKVYGVTGVTGSILRKQALSPDKRFGLLTQGSFLATHAYPYDSAPVKRGVAVREALLCQSVPPPPRDLVVTVPIPDPTKSAREQFEQHSADPTCKGCHGLFDPLGFAFENYDGIGTYRTISGGKVVNASGTLTGLTGGAERVLQPGPVVDRGARKPGVPRVRDRHLAAFCPGPPRHQGRRSGPRRIAAIVHRIEWRPARVGRRCRG